MCIDGLGIGGCIHQTKDKVGMLEGLGTWQGSIYVERNVYEPQTFTLDNIF